MDRVAARLAADFVDDAVGGRAAETPRLPRAAVRNPAAGLQWLDELEKVPAAVLHLGMLVNAFYGETHAERQPLDWNAIHRQLLEFLSMFRMPRFTGATAKTPGGPNGPIGREHLLRFCGQAGITGADLINLIAASPNGNVTSLAPPAGDRPFQILCLAQQAFWA